MSATSTTASGLVWGNSSWGEVRVEQGASAIFLHAIFSGGGSSVDKDKQFGHSGSQPVLRAMTMATDKSNSNRRNARSSSSSSSPRLTVIGGAVVDCVGKVSRRRQL
jgi:hypothetical protein